MEGGLVLLLSIIVMTLATDCTEGSFGCACNSNSGTKICQCNTAKKFVTDPVDSTRCSCPQSYQFKYDGCIPACTKGALGCECSLTTDGEICDCLYGINFELNNSTFSCQCMTGYILSGSSCVEPCTQGKTGCSCILSSCVCNSNGHFIYDFFAGDGSCKCGASYQLNGATCEELTCTSGRSGCLCTRINGIEVCKCNHDLGFVTSSNNCNCADLKVGNKCVRTCLDGNPGCIYSGSAVYLCDEANHFKIDATNSYCICQSGYQYYKGQCLKTCTKATQGCGCTRTGPRELCMCTTDSHFINDGINPTCICAAGYQLSEGLCVQTCTKNNNGCGCTGSGQSELCVCTTASHFINDGPSAACKCANNYILSGQSCVLQACTKSTTGCECSGSDADEQCICSSDSNFINNGSDPTCICADGYKLSGTSCVLTCTTGSNGCLCTGSGDSELCTCAVDNHFINNALTQSCVCEETYYQDATDCKIVECFNKNLGCIPKTVGGINVDVCNTDNHFINNGKYGTCLCQDTYQLSGTACVRYCTKGTTGCLCSTSNDIELCKCDSSSYYANDGSKPTCIQTCSEENTGCGCTGLGTSEQLCTCTTISHFISDGTTDKCKCDSGYQLSGSSCVQICIQGNSGCACTGSGADKLCTCDNNSHYINDGETSSCTCADGYQLSKNSCVQICTKGNSGCACTVSGADELCTCDSNSHYINDGETYSCTCANGYQLSGNSCTQICTKGTIGCLCSGSGFDELCTCDSASNFSNDGTNPLCVCSEGFTLADNICKTNSFSCPANSTQSYSGCSCNTGFEFNSGKTACSCIKGYSYNSSSKSCVKSTSSASHYGWIAALLIAVLLC